MRIFDMPKSGAWEERGGWVVRQLMVDLDLTDVQAAGLVGNLGAESKGFEDMQEKRPTAGRGGWGWAQWTGPRRRDFENWARNRNLDVSSDEANYGFLVYELTGKQKNFLAKLRGALDLQEATRWTLTMYENPSDQSQSALNKRLEWAQRALDGARTKPTAPTDDGAADQDVSDAEMCDAILEILEGNVRTAQFILLIAGHDPGEIDAIWGPLTQAAHDALRREARRTTGQEVAQ